MRKSFFVFLLVLLAALTLAAGSARRKAHTASLRLPAGAINAIENINPERIRAHVRFLSDDLLEGRGTGQRGGDIAANYLATEFALDGLSPAGDGGGYLQKVPMVGVTVLPETTFTMLPNQGQPMPLRLGERAVHFGPIAVDLFDVRAGPSHAGDSNLAVGCNPKNRGDVG